MVSDCVRSPSSPALDVLCGHSVGRRDEEKVHAEIEMEIKNPGFGHANKKETLGDLAIRLRTLG